MQKLAIDVDMHPGLDSGPCSVVEALNLSVELHNPLMVVDLFQNVLDCFHPTIDPVDRQTLVALAQSCHAFSEPSLNRLWKNPGSLKPLIQCYTTLDEFETQGPPTPSQLAIIDKYSHRVREVVIADDTSVRFLQFASIRPSLLLPNLVVLRWNPYVLTHLPIFLIQPLLSPQLVSLEATLAEEDGPELLSFFNNYPILCQALTSIEFRFSNQLKPGSMMRALSRAICSQASLASVVVHAPVHEMALRYLCQLSTLKSLSIHLPESSGSLINFLQSTDSLFCNVEELSFTSSDLDLVTRLLRPREQIFHGFRLHHRDRLRSDTLISFFHLLTSRSTLQKLALSCGDFSKPVPAQQMPSEAIHYRLSYNTLHPLVSLSSLRELVIQWSEQISLDDAELRTLARSWPSLRVLNFYCGRGGYPPFSSKYPTLVGLVALVASCPELCTVSLPLDARQVPNMVEEKAHETEFACLVVPESPIDEPLPVAEFLRNHLPSVTTVDARFLRPPGTDTQQILAYERAWQQVEIHLDEFNGWAENPWGSDPLDSDSDTDLEA